MQLSSIPAKIAAIFAASAAPTSKNTIPLTQAGILQPGQASFDVGFPAVTMQPAASGGINPYGQDFNGILNAVTAVEMWQSAGGFFPYDATFASSVGGYPKGSILSRVAGTGFWLCTTDNNSTNPETGGAGWITFAADWTTGVDTGAASAALVNYTPVVTTLVDGMVLWFKAAAANTGATTLNVNGLGAKPVIGGAHAALQGGEIVAAGKCQVVYSATLAAFVLIECTGGALQVGTGSASQQAVAVGQLFGGLKGIVSFTSSGSWVCPAGVTKAYLSACAGGGGGGGGGGGAGGNVGGSAGAGGSGQSVLRVGATVTPGATYTVTIGAAGGGGGTISSGSGSNGTGGGNTAISGTGVSIVCIAGGGGGGGISNNATRSAAGLAGTGAPAGGAGSDSNSGAGCGPGGTGGASLFGGGGGGGRSGYGSAQPGDPGAGYGSGGGGAGGTYQAGSGAGAIGGNGASGFCLIEW